MLDGRFLYWGLLQILQLRCSPIRMAAAAVSSPATRVLSIVRKQSDSQWSSAIVRDRLGWLGWLGYLSENTAGSVPWRDTTAS